MNDIFDTLIEVNLKEDQNFLKIKETLTRIGIASKKENKLWQSCHILHKKGRYFIIHFKELFILDGKFANLTEEDLSRRNAIAMLLDEWGLCSIVNKTKFKDLKINLNQIKIIPYKEKDNWFLESKYSIGKVKHRSND